MINVEYYMEMIRLLLNHIEEKKNTYLSIMIKNKNSILMDIVDDVINKNILEQIKEENNKRIPSTIITKFYLGGVINVCLEWLKYDNKYSKEEIINYIDKLIPNDII